MPELHLALPDGSVVVVVEVVEDVVVELVVELVVVTGSVVLVVWVVLVVGQGQLSCTGCPTANLRQTSASVAVIGVVPFGAQIHSGLQVTLRTAALRMNRQSEAVGRAPFVSGCEQSPWAARAAGAGSNTAAIVAATTRWANAWKLLVDFIGAILRRCFRILKRGEP
ncbi:MAG: hypothetical protein D6815_00005 [Candidatus Dadabacteria bacterium]|nr:MAG: hypothetical protein D6815_00005 [Candidatus Dadabacteria bacterium]